MDYNFNKYCKLQLAEAKLLDKNNSIKIIKNIAKDVKNSGYHLYIIGGAVRDEILGLIPNDYDLNTDMPQDKYITLFDTNNGIHNRRVKDIVFTTKDGEEFETSILRPGYDISKQCLETDLTINSLAKDPLTNDIIDVYNTGINDIKNHILRFTDFSKTELREGRLLGNFWRMLYFYSRFGWNIEDDSIQTMKYWIKIRNDKIYPYNKKMTEKTMGGKFSEKMYILCKELGIYNKLWSK